MQEQFKNIFVTLEVAKMAKEKGFNEWCAAYYSVRHETIFPNIDGFGNLMADCDNPQECIELPTHYQLMMWLLKNHKIDVWYYCYDLHDNYSDDRDDWPIDINDALLEALKLIEHE